LSFHFAKNIVDDEEDDNNDYFLIEKKQIQEKKEKEEKEEEEEVIIIIIQVQARRSANVDRSEGGGLFASLSAETFVRGVQIQ